jgi:multidrug efflux system outer membrane protein
LPVFEGGRNRANLERAKAAYDEALAVYRQQVLIALQEVETTLSALRVLAEQSDAQARSLASARKTVEISSSRYKAGLVTYLDVTDAERQALANERLLATLTGQRLTTAVGLMKALGGGWTPPPAGIAQSAPLDQPRATATVTQRN